MCRIIFHLQDLLHWLCTFILLESSFSLMLFYNNFRSKRLSTDIYLNLISSFDVDMWQLTFKDLISFVETPYIFMQPQRCYVDAGFYTETKCVVHPICSCQAFHLASKCDFCNHVCNTWRRHREKLEFANVPADCS